ncbi:MAG: HEAT repeat domain-containing protein [Planctomycetales bacterium]|nr:HEAT repeat domain-containing protein [Planctomycetales bacterium]
MNDTSKARAWVILLALAGGVLVFQLVERTKGWTARSRAEQLGSELLSAETPEQLEAIARELGTLDDAAAKPLVEALVSDDPFISAAAGNEISRLLAAWRQQPRKSSGTKVSALAKELAGKCDSIPPEQQRLARQWAEGILLWPLKGSGVDTATVLTDCEAILAMPPPDEDHLAERLARLARRKKKEQEQEQRQENPLDVEMQTEGIPPQDFANLPPIVSPENVPLPPSVSESSAADDFTEVEEPNSFPRNPREPRGIYVPRARPIEEASPPAEPNTLPKGEPSLLPPIKASASQEELTSLPDREVMLDLHSEDAAITAAAEKELSRRGYKAVHLSIARQLTDPDSAVRLKLVQALPRARGIDPRPWLLRLSEDRDEGVRAAALSILRTSQDPELLQKLR